MTRYALTPHGFTVSSQPEGQLVVMDSFLVADGKVAGLTLHGKRFARSVRELLGHDTPPGLHDLACDLIPGEGRWFPRLSAHRSADTVDYHLWVRPAPPQREATTLWVPEFSDPRTRPRHKGPDRELLARLRAEARDRGADDCLLHDGTYLVEAANAAVVGVDTRGVMVVPPAHCPHLPSVTVHRAARRRPVRAGRIRVAEAEQWTLWTASALHGFVPVTGWVHG